MAPKLPVPSSALPAFKAALDAALARLRDRQPAQAAAIGEAGGGARGPAAAAHRAVEVVKVNAVAARHGARQCGAVVQVEGHCQRLHLARRHPQVVAQVSHDVGAHHLRHLGHMVQGVVLRPGEGPGRRQEGEGEGEGVMCEARRSLHCAAARRCARMSCTAWATAHQVEEDHGRAI